MSDMADAMRYAMESYMPSPTTSVWLSYTNVNGERLERRLDNCTVSWDVPKDGPVTVGLDRASGNAYTAIQSGSISVERWEYRHEDSVHVGLESGNDNSYRWCYFEMNTSEPTAYGRWDSLDNVLSGLTPIIAENFIGQARRRNRVQQEQYGGARVNRWPGFSGFGRVAEELYGTNNKTANEKARTLLLSLLTPAQTECFENNGYIPVSVGDKQYDICINTTFNVAVKNKYGDTDRRLCVQPTKPVCLYDHLITQLLWLETNPQEFLRVANRA